MLAVSRELPTAAIALEGELHQRDSLDHLVEERNGHVDADRAEAHLDLFADLQIARRDGCD